MQCGECKKTVRINAWKCPFCRADLTGGLVFVTGIPGSGTEEFLRKVESDAKAHGHDVEIFDVGETMHQFALKDDPDVKWNQILDADPILLRSLRNLACLELKHRIEMHPEVLRIVDLHLSFRWKIFLTKGFEPYVISEFSKHIRLFVNLFADLVNVQAELASTSWGKREILELIIWRDEELFLSDIFADISGRVNSLALSINEPPNMLENIIWHPDRKRVYLSFPITNIMEDEDLKREIEDFRDAMREFLVVFDPYSSKDYDDIKQQDELKSLRPEIRDVTVSRDNRFIDQSEAIVVYFPKMVDSKGVDAEMNHALRTGKKIFLYSPGDLGGGPFAIEPGHFSPDRGEYLELLKRELVDDSQEEES